MKCLILVFFYFISLSNQKNLKKECSSDWTQLNNNKCIFISEQKVNFFEAKKFCENKTSTLVSITSENENKQLTKLLFNDLEYIEDFWLGGKLIDDKGNFKWLNKNLLTNYNNFHIDDHEFHLNEYLVLLNTIQTNKNNVKELGTWCSFNPNIMFLAICQISDSENNSEKEPYKDVKLLNDEHWTIIIVTTVSLLTLFMIIYYYLYKNN